MLWLGVCQLLAFRLIIQDEYIKIMGFSWWCQKIWIQIMVSRAGIFHVRHSASHSRLIATEKKRGFYDEGSGYFDPFYQRVTALRRAKIVWRTIRLITQPEEWRIGVTAKLVLTTDPRVVVIVYLFLDSLNFPQLFYLFFYSLNFPLFF